MQNRDMIETLQSKLKQKYFSHGLQYELMPKGIFHRARQYHCFALRKYVKKQFFI